MVRPAHNSRVISEEKDVDEYLQGGRESICPGLTGVTTEDQLVLKRVVGMLEYYLALRYLQPVWDEATAAERKAMDRIVKDAPELAFFSLLPTDEKSSQKRHSMIWVLALARLEFNAIMAGFSHADRPFAWSADDTEVQQAYDALLWEALQLHLGELVDEPDLLDSLSRQKVPDTGLLSTMKRLSLTDALAEEVLQNVNLQRQIGAPGTWSLRRHHKQVTETMDRIRANMLRYVETNQNRIGRLDRELVIRTVTLR